MAKIKGITRTNCAKVPMMAPNGPPRTCNVFRGRIRKSPDDLCNPTRMGHPSDHGAIRPRHIPSLAALHFLGSAEVELPGAITGDSIDLCSKGCHDGWDGEPTVWPRKNGGILPTGGLELHSVAI